MPLANFTFAYSYGDPQEVRVNALRTLGAISVKYRINGGPIQTATTREWNGGEKYGAKTDRYYRIMRGFVTGTQPGDSVQVWFEGGSATSDSFTYQAAVETSHDVLVVAAEDYTGASPVQTPGPHYLSYYLNALAANGITADVYNIDASGRRAPDVLGVLSHYDAVVFYTGDDIVTREAGWGGGNASRLAQDNLLELRDYMNGGGKVLYAGKRAGDQYQTGGGIGLQLYDPTAANAQCRANPAVQARCLQLAGSGDLVNDTLEYWLGAFLVNTGAGFNPDTGNIYDGIGWDTPFTGLSWSYNGADSAQNHNTATSYIATSGILPVSEYPQFDSWVAAKYDRPGGPFDPHTGSKYAYSQIADQSFKRFTHTVNVPAAGADMSFWVSYNTEQDWDMVFVEAHTVGQDDWTTLPDLNGHTNQETGESCKAENGPGGWRTIHPFMDHYQTQVGTDSCDPHGTTGDWYAVSGSSGGWQQWHVDLSGFAGKQIEVSISYVSDWATQGLGVFVDDIVVSTGEGSTSFETGADGWQAPDAPEGSVPNFNTWIVTDAAGFPEGSVIATPDSLLMGFGLEGVSDAAVRSLLMGRAMDYLLD